MQSYVDNYSHHAATRSLGAWLEAEGVPGITGIDTRTLTRRFREQTGMSPLQWILHERVTRARELLETTGSGIEEVARLSGLGSADSLRAHLLRSIGLTPTAYRAAFRRPANV